MAVLDTERGAFVLRIVFDGLARGGKTTTVRALAKSLSRPASSPGELDGRTLYFDWLDYTGGRFEGHSIRCQLVSVPGQPGLKARRRKLLEAADAVVFVVDSRENELPAALEEAVRVRALLNSQARPAPGLIIQANKRDLPGAVSTSKLKQLIADRLSGTAVVETTALEGVGVREAFVLGVRLGLDRVQELIQRDELVHSRPEVEGPEDLLRQIDAPPALASVFEPDGVSPPDRIVPEVGKSSALRSEPEVEAPRRNLRSPGSPAPPSASIPSGTIWPPVEGRVYLYEAGTSRMQPRALPNGDWNAAAEDGWILHSPADAGFEDPETSRAALIDWARFHAGALGLVSQRRCIALADDGGGAPRLWQLVQRSKSLRDLLEEAFKLPSPHAVADALLECGRLLVIAEERFETGGVELGVDLDSVGTSGSSPIFIGLMPFPIRAGGPPQARRRIPGQEFDLLENAFGSVVREHLEKRSAAIPKIVDRIFRCTQTWTERRELCTILGMIVLGERP